MFTMVDFYCGLGGASEPFRDAGWRVVRVDIEERFKPDVVADFRALPFHPFGDLFWASIPCDGFARCALPWKVALPGDDSTELAHATMSLIREWNPRTWVVECSQLSRRWLTPIFGAVRAGTSGHAFWSNRSLLIPSLRARKERMGPCADRPAQRAKIPYDIGDAIRRPNRGDLLIMDFWRKNFGRKRPLNRFSEAGAYSPIPSPPKSRVKR